MCHFSMTLRTILSLICIDDLFLSSLEYGYVLCCTCEHCEVDSKCLLVKVH